MKFNILDLLPVGRDGTKTMLAKQQEFFSLANTPPSHVDEMPHYIAYVGGVGSGKTKIGCLTMIALALQEAGDYLICRQFMPELRRTTYKEFMDMVDKLPPQLLVEHRVAEARVTLRAANGLSHIYFAPLEEPDKYRSMTLNAWYIDECNQVSSEAFTLLQTRTRGRAWRKGILTSNPSGHDWVYRWFYKKENMKDFVKPFFHLIRAPTTENTNLSKGYIDSMIATWSEDRIKREIMGSFDAFEGMVYNEFDQSVHVVKPFKIPDHWPKYIGIDHGLRNPAAWVWCAVGEDGEVYAYREFYQKEWLIHEIINGKDGMPGVLRMMGTEKITQAFIDPSTKRRNGSSGESDWDEYVRNLPNDFPLYPARNDVQLGIDRVKSYFKVDPRFKKPRLYIFDTCHNLLEEISQYRYQELKAGQVDKRANYEKPVKANDHAIDALRYVVVTLPEPYVESEDKKYDIYTQEGRLGAIVSSFKKKSGGRNPFES